MENRPNIVWIVCEGLRTDALGCYQPAFAGLRTPNIDGLASRGVVFDNCFANAPASTASRVAMVTGLLPEQSGVYHDDAAVDPLGSVPTFVGQLAAAGYTVTAPDAAGTSGSAMLPCFRGARAMSATEVVDEALPRLADARRPFLLTASFVLPHFPVAPPEPWASLYDPDVFTDGAVGADDGSAFEKRFREVCHPIVADRRWIGFMDAYYYATVAWIDDEIGRLLRGLAAQGLDQSTVVVVMGDHGLSLGTDGAIGGHTFAPGNQRIPFVLAGPGLDAQRRDDLAQGVDVARTLCGIAGVKAPSTAGGRDLLAGDPAPPYVWSTIGYGEQASYAVPSLRLGRFDDRGWPRRSCVRTDRWRLDCTTRIDGVRARSNEGDIFLTDWRLHPKEDVNLAGERGAEAVVDELLAVVDSMTFDVAGSRRP